MNADPLRWPVIRHVRWLYLSWRFRQWCDLWTSLGYFPQQSDIDHLDRIRRGDA